MKTSLGVFSGEVEINKVSVSGHSDRVNLKVYRYGASAEAELSASDVDAIIHLLQAARIKMT